MEVNLIVPKRTDVSVILKEYPDLYEDEGYDEDQQSYWCGTSMEESADEDGEWMTHDECVEFCGFCEGAIELASTLIEGNGGWAQGMISCKDFSDLAFSDEDKASRKATSKLYWASHARGLKLRIIQERR